MQEIEKQLISREDSLNAVPLKSPVIASEKKNDKLLLTVEFERPRWQQFLGAEKKCTKTFALDNIGSAVYQLCNGENTVATIIKKISQDYKISISDAEISVTTFMKTLIAKGLIAIAVQKKGQKDENRKDTK